MTGALLYDTTSDGSPKIGEWIPLRVDKLPIPATDKPQKTKKKYYTPKIICDNKCQVCGKTFKAKRNDATFCSARCRQVASRQNRQLNLGI